MLDQNTDRMWYVIGAVIIGAAIILIMNNTFPQLFASVGETFKSKTEQTTEVVDGIMPKTKLVNGLTADKLQLNNAQKIAYDEASGTWTLQLNTPLLDTHWWSSGLSITHGKVIVPYGQRYTISYEVFVPANVVDARAETDLNFSRINTSDPAWSGNNNDLMSERLFNGQKSYPVERKGVALKSGAWTTVTASGVNADPRNVDKVDLTNVSYFGVYNHTASLMEVKIRNITGTLSEY